MPILKRRELLGTALKIIACPQILNALTVGGSVPHALQTPEKMDFVDIQIQRAILNTENWFAKHTEHCLKRISWSGPISDWSEQLHQHLDRFEQSATGEDGGPRILITRAQMELLSWQTRASTGADPCETRLFVATMFLIDMTISYSDPPDQSGSTTFAAALKSQHPSLHESLVAALRALNIDEVLEFVNDCPKLEDLRFDASELLRDHARAIAPAIKGRILSLLQVSQASTDAAEDLERPHVFCS